MNARRILTQTAMVIGGLSGWAFAGVSVLRNRTAHQTQLSQHNSKSTSDSDKANRQYRTYHSFDTPFVINLRDSDLSVQLRVALSFRNALAYESVRRRDLAIRSAIIVALTQLGPGIVSGRVDKQSIKATIRQAVNHDLEPLGIYPMIEEVYLTEFLVVGLDA